MSPTGQWGINMRFFGLEAEAKVYRADKGTGCRCSICQLRPWTAPCRSVDKQTMLRQHKHHCRLPCFWSSCHCQSYPAAALKHMRTQVCLIIESSSLSSFLSLINFHTRDVSNLLSIDWYGAENLSIIRDQTTFPYNSSHCCLPAFHKIGTKVHCWAYWAGAHISLAAQKASLGVMGGVKVSSRLSW